VAYLNYQVRAELDRLPGPIPALIRNVLKQQAEHFRLTNVLCSDDGIAWARHAYNDKRPVAMCEKCVEIDEKIARYRKLSSSVADQITIERVKALIEDLQAQKAALHLEV
jgi:hypothetical protein